MNILEESNALRDYEMSRRVILSPKQWATFVPPVSFAFAWRVKRVAVTLPAQIPADKKGVYSFVVDPGIADHPRTSYLMYVGKAAGAEGFRARYKKYYAERNHDVSDRALVNRMIKTWFDHLWFCFAELPDAAIEATENALLRAYLPPYNTEFPADVGPAVKALG